MLLKSVTFEVSNTNVDKCPKERIPEYAFIGRSNVGKSSLINMLTNQKIAKTSGTPGKTQLINHFKINENWFLVDLPGYGYAQVSKTKRQKFQSFITEYFKKREQLVCTFVLIDSRHKPQKTDLAFMEFLGANQIPFCLIFTKIDKLKSHEVLKNVAAYKKEMLATLWDSIPPSFTTSSSSKQGRDALLSYIEDINTNFETAPK